MYITSSRRQRKAFRSWFTVVLLRKKKCYSVAVMFALDWNTFEVYHKSATETEREEKTQQLNFGRKASSKSLTM